MSLEACEELATPHTCVSGEGSQQSGMGGVVRASLRSVSGSKVLEHLSVRVGGVGTRVVWVVLEGAFVCLTIRDQLRVVVVAVPQVEGW